MRVLHKEENRQSFSPPSMLQLQQVDSELTVFWMLCKWILWLSLIFKPFRRVPSLELNNVLAGTMRHKAHDSLMNILNKDTFLIQNDIMWENVAVSPGYQENLGELYSVFQLLLFLIIKMRTRKIYPFLCFLLTLRPIHYSKRTETICKPSDIQQLVSCFIVRKNLIQSQRIESSHELSQCPNRTASCAHLFLASKKL